MGNVNKLHYLEDKNGVAEMLRDQVNYSKTKVLKVSRAIFKSRGYSIEDYRHELSAFNNGNDAILDYTPNGKHKEKKYFIANSAINDSKSLFAGIGNSHGTMKHGPYVLIKANGRTKFNVIITNRNRSIGIGHKRHVDTEYKLLENLATNLSPQDIGHINLYTYFEPCLSCDYVFIQFNKMFPNISIDVFYEEEYRP